MLWGSGKSLVSSYGFGKLQVSRVWKVEGAFEVVGKGSRSVNVCERLAGLPRMLPSVKDARGHVLGGLSPPPSINGNRGGSGLPFRLLGILGRAVSPNAREKVEACAELGVRTLDDRRGSIYRALGCGLGGVGLVQGL